MTEHEDTAANPLPTVESAEQRDIRCQRFLEEEIWPYIPAELRGKSVSKAEIEEILGLGPDGV